MSPSEHNKYLALGYVVFAAIFGFTFLLLMLISAEVFVALGITFASETGDANQAGIGVLGGVFAVIFYLVLGAITVLPTAVASRKMWKGKPHARTWGIIAAILVAPIAPLGTALAVYGLWFLFSAEGRRFYLSVDSGALPALPNH